MEWKIRRNFLLILIANISVSLSWVECHRMKEKELQVITLKKGEYTMSRRTKPVPQLRCLSNCEVTPDVVQCYNRGWDGLSNNWECKAALPPGVSFGQMDVNCEGYEYPDDPYITVGSCSLGYHLRQNSYGPYSQRGSYRTNRKDEGYSGTFFNIVFYLILFVILFTLLKSCSRANRVGDGMGGDDGGPWDSFRRRFDGGFPPGGPGFRPDYFTPGDSCDGLGRRPANNGPGFWSGAMAGGLLGYLFGNRGEGVFGRNNEYTRTRWRPRYSNDDEGSYGPQPSTSDWGSSGTQESSGYATGSRR